MYAPGVNTYRLDALVVREKYYSRFLRFFDRSVPLFRLLREQLVCIYCNITIQCFR